MLINLLQKQTCHLKNITYNHSAMRDEILIYNDSGTGDIRPLRDSLREYFSPQGIKIDTVTADDIIKNDRLNGRVLAFFMPGGRATPYLEKLKVRGNQKIAEYVQSGGVYFGICAGAYYASRNVFFETDIKDAAVVQQCGLNLIDADAVGTLHRELGIAPYSQDFRSMAAAKVLWRADNERHIASYHGGPYFKPLSHSRIQVLAEYEFEGKTLPAVVMQKHGAGTAIVSGLHIEDTGQNLKRILNSLLIKEPDAYGIASALEEGEAARRALFCKMMAKIRQ